MNFTKSQFEREETLRELDLLIEKLKNYNKQV